MVKSISQRSLLTLSLGLILHDIDRVIQMEPDEAPFTPHLASSPLSHQHLDSVLAVVQKVMDSIEMSASKGNFKPSVVVLSPSGDSNKSLPGVEVMTPVISSTVSPTLMETDQLPPSKSPSPSAEAVPVGPVSNPNPAIPGSPPIEDVTVAPASKPNTAIPAFKEAGIAAEAGPSQKRSIRDDEPGSGSPSKRPKSSSKVEVVLPTIKTVHCTDRSWKPTAHALGQ